MKEKFGISTKKYMVEELKATIADNPNFVITNYKGLSSSDVESLRKKLRKSSSKYCVVKNSLAKRVFDQLELEGLDSFLKGEVGIGFIGDVTESSKALVSFSKEHSALKLNCAFLDGKIENVDRIEHLAMLPPKETLIAMVLNGMKSPITGFVGVLSALLRNFVYAVNEIKNKKEGGESK